MIRGELLDAQRIHRFEAIQTQKVNEIRNKNESEQVSSPRDIQEDPTNLLNEGTHVSILDFRLSKLDVRDVFVGIAHLIDEKTRDFWDLIVCSFLLELFFSFYLEIWELNIIV